MTKCNKLLLLFLLIFQNCSSITIRNKQISIREKDLIKAINNANVQFTLSSDKISRLNFVDKYKEVFTNDEGIDKFKIGLKPETQDVLQLRLPIDSSTKDFISFMLAKKKQLVKYYFEDTNKSFFKHFISTLSFCESTLTSSKQHQVITVGVFDLLDNFLNNYEIKNDILIPYKKNKRINVTNDMVKRIVLNDGYFDKMNLNCLIYIPKDKTVNEFISACASKVKQGDENEFMEVVLRYCQLKQTENNQQVKWVDIITEMEIYYFHPSDTPRFQKNSLFGISLFNFDNLLNPTCFEILQKLSLQFNNVVISRPKKDVDVILDCIAVALKLYDVSKVESHEGIIELFTIVMYLCSSEDFINYYNISVFPGINNNLKVIEISKREFNGMVKFACQEEPSTFIITIGEAAPGKRISIFKSNQLIEFSDFPYNWEEILNTQELMTNYATFIGISIDSTKDYNDVLQVFWEKFWNKKILRDYEEYLKTGAIKKSQVSEEMAIKVDTRSDELNNSNRNRRNTGNCRKLKIILTMVCFINLSIIGIFVCILTYGNK